MKSNLIIVISLIFTCLKLQAKGLDIQAKDISIEKKNKITVFKEDVIIKTQENITIKTDYLEYNKESGLLKLKNNIKTIDDKSNTIETEYAEYDEKNKIFKSVGPTKIISSDGYVVNTDSVIFNKIENTIFSENTSEIIDKEGNIISLNNFSYETQNNIFKSAGKIKVTDNKKNTYEFSQIYIDTKKKELIGTDIKAFINDPDFKVKEKNKPRVFSNTLQLNDNKKTFGKSIFTLCDFREKDKCPPWTIQATKMLHDSKKKTIYYNNAVIKVYDLPIFYLPKLSHPDPTVDRRSGFLPPSLMNSKNLGNGISLPYFWDIKHDKNLTITNNIFFTENPLFLAEYHQAFKDANLKTDIGFTQGYKKTTSSKKAGDKSHFFSKYVKSFKGKNGSDNTFELNIQDTSNDKYLKLYKIKSDLVDYEKDYLENSLSFTHQKDDLFLGINSIMYETLKDTYNDKYEYILPEITLDKNIFASTKFGILDLQSNFEIQNYDTNKTSKLLINDFDWEIKNTTFYNSLKSKFFSKIKNINYDAKNIVNYKNDTTSELYGALGYLAELDFVKKAQSTHFLSPKILLKYAPGSMRKEEKGSRLDPDNAFTLDRLDTKENFETGLSASVGFDYEIDDHFALSVAQVINEKENDKMPNNTGLNEKLSDLVGETNIKLSENLNLKYNFSIDQNYNDFNYNEFQAKFNFDKLSFNLDYLQESKHIGNNEYIKADVSLFNKDKSEIKFKTKRSLITNSAEYYDLSYEYINDCLRAGIVYRREFYNDSEIEAENSLMFKITLIPFGGLDIDAPN